MKCIKMTNGVTIIFILALIVGCQKRQWNGNMSEYLATHQSARSAIPAAVQMEEIFGDADHFITSFGADSNPKTWNTDVFFGGRYSLAMEVEVHVDYDKRTVKQIGKPRFWLNEVTSVQDLGDGRVMASFDGLHKEFSEDDWIKFYDAKGGWSALQVQLDATPAPSFDRYVKGKRKDRVPVKLIVPDHEDEHQQE